MNKKEYVSCNLCGSKGYYIKFKKNGFNIVKCKKCGLYYVNPRLKQEVLSDMYNKNQVSSTIYYKETNKDDEKTFIDRIKLIQKYLGKKTSINALDIGCNIGTFIKVMKEKGWKVIGTDINKGSLEYCQKLYRIRTICGNFERIILPESYFDVIIMNDFIEHVHSPLAALKKALKLLIEDGILFMSTPDIGSFISKISGKRWLHLKPDEHIYFFSRRTIKKMLNVAGLKIMWVGSLGRVRNLRIILLKSQTYTKIIWDIVNKLKLDRLLNRFSFKLNLGDEIGVIAKK
jgi:2-polyprenyl-3-methyl-5-hydroxy-6-metoxy-1,4-benzoquinol methylase